MLSRLKMQAGEKPYRHIVITGASSGIGKALARVFSEEGVRLSLFGRSRERLEKVAQECRAKGAEIHVIVADIRDRQAMDRELKTLDKIQPVDLVIANAGISAGTGGPEAGETLEQVEEIFAVNWQGVLNTVYPLLATMRARKKGHIALMSSLAGFRGFPGAPAYCASKAAVRVFGESLHGGLKSCSSDLKVSVICPGFIETPMTDVNDFPMPFLMQADRASQEIKKALLKGKTRIAFPLRLALLVWFISLLPEALAQRLLQRLPAKPAKPNQLY